MARWKLLLLGPPRLEQDGQAIHISRRKAMALLAYLVVTGQSHSRDALAAMLWPETDQARARAGLRRTLWDLTQVLGDFWIDVGPKTLTVRPSPDLWVDYEAFHALLSTSQTHDHAPDETCTDCVPFLTEAVTLYRDDFLAGFSLPDSPAFDEWQFFRTENLRQELAETLEKLSRYYIAQENFETAIPYARRWLALDPLLEAPHRMLMELYAWAGRRAAALRQYEEYVRVIDEGLSLGPREDMTVLYEEIRQNRVTPAQKGQATRPRPADQERSKSATPAQAVVYPETQRHPPIPFVARERELEKLEEFLKLALAGRGRVVFVSGDAGSGKTALVREFTRRAQATHSDLIVASGNCNAYSGVGGPYLPFREILVLLTGDVEAEWATERLNPEAASRLWRSTPTSIQTLLDDGPDLIEKFISGLALLNRAEMVAASHADWLRQLKALVSRKEASAGSDHLKQHDLFDQYTKVMSAMARRHPLLLVVDDLQWADIGSLSLLFHLGRRLKSNRILIVGAYRPADLALGHLSIQPTLAEQPAIPPTIQQERHPLLTVVNEFQRHFGQIKVRLDQAQNRKFVEAYLDTQPNRLSSRFREALYRHTGGQALFTVETLRAMQERGDLVQDEKGYWIEGPTIDWETLPARVEGIIGERLARLPAELRELLKVASIEGEDFTAEVVAQVRGADPWQIVQQLSNELDQQHRLVRSQGSQQLGQQRLSSYRFRHILFQQYLYDGLTEAERLYLHEMVGRVFEQLYEGRTDQAAPELARHFQAAGLAQKAIHYLQQAGQRAVRLSANDEAITHFSEGLALIETLPETPARNQQELKLHLGLSTPLVLMKGYAAPRVELTYVRARELCQQVGDSVQLATVLRGLWDCYLVQAQHRQAYQLAEQLFGLAQEVQDPILLMEAHWIMGETFYSLGELLKARTHQEQAMALYDAEAYRNYPFRAVQDPGLSTKYFNAAVLWLLGYPDQALQRIHEAVALADQRSNPFNLISTLFFAGIIHQFRREPHAVQARAEAVISLSTRYGFTLPLGWGKILLGWALPYEGQAAAGITRLRQGMDAWQATRAEAGRPHYMGLLAEIHQQVGQIDQGLSILDEALAAVDESEERWWEAELYRLRGELLIQRYRLGENSADNDALAEVEASLNQALEIARQQQAKSLELRAVLSLYRLWQAVGTPEQRKRGHRMLADLYDWFTEGFDTADLQEAQALLEAESGQVGL